ncbi:Fur family transcriptional regulator [Planctomycetota bacterium]
MKKKNKTMSRTELDKKLQGFMDRCRESGRKVTTQRVTVYRELVRSKDHPSAEMLHRKIKKTSPSISLDTVNRTLLTLYDMGEASILEGSGDPKRFDAGMEKHQHFRCIQCKRIIDFHHKPFDEIKVPAGLSKKLTVLRKTIYLEGICDRCGRH